MKEEMTGWQCISGTICKSFAPCCRQITTPAPHHSILYRPDAFPGAQFLNQQCQNTEGNNVVMNSNCVNTKLLKIQLATINGEVLQACIQGSAHAGASSDYQNLDDFVLVLVDLKLWWWFGSGQCVNVRNKWCVLKAKFHCTSWFEAGRRQVRSQIPLRYLVRSWSATSFEPASNQLA